MVPAMSGREPNPVTRRDALKIMGAAVAATGLRLPPAAAAETAPPVLGWVLPALPFAYGALEPHLDSRTMEIHHTKHHEAYITNARNLLKDHPDLLARGPEALVRDLAAVPEALRTGVRNNAGGHVNHAFFWQLLSPAPSTAMSANSRLSPALREAFGADLEGFKKQFADVALKRFGSGWAWLSAKPDGRLVLHSTANQDSPLSDGLVPVIGLDVWEHAYYLHYQNRRADYVTAFWQVLDWAQAERNYARVLRG
jgi:superoxide dismutase, Fe-Mn family